MMSEGRLDLGHLEDVVAVAIAGEVDHLIARGAQRLSDREQHGVAQTAA
jgi:hypothetical protein